MLTDTVFRLSLSVRLRAEEPGRCLLHALECCSGQRAPQDRCPEVRSAGSEVPVRYVRSVLGRSVPQPHMGHFRGRELFTDSLCLECCEKLAYLMTDGQDRVARGQIEMSAGLRICVLGLQR